MRPADIVAENVEARLDIYERVNALGIGALGLGGLMSVVDVTRSLAVELALRGIRVNAVAPVIGAIALLESFLGLPDTPENQAKFIASIPLGRLSEPDDVAEACLHLASDEAKFVTGVVLEVDGGRTI